ncbi:MAG: hypothetical protein QOC62_1068 [Mycobacterium sp.]|nr:hypothetical protein [Mycobacterium sp.]
MTDQLLLFGCARCGVPESGTVSSRLCDSCLRTVLEGCTSGEYECWLEHPQYCGWFVSSFGWVKSPDGRMSRGADGNGYLRVQMPDRKRRVHQLVLETFIGPRPEGMKGLHWDDVKTDNRLMNLRWGTDADNKRDQRRNRWPACGIDGCDRPAMGGASGAKCSEHYWHWRAEVAQRALELTAR